jgi:hypothetical protein
MGLLERVKEQVKQGHSVPLREGRRRA